MPGLQEWIHKLEEGEGARILKLLTLLLVLATVTVVYNLREARNFGTPEAMDLSQLARNLSQGRGFTTDFVRPLSMHLLEKHRADRSPMLDQPHPDLANPPVYPFLIAGLMKLLPFNYAISDPNTFLKYQPEVWIGWFNQALFFLLALLVFFLARRLFDAAVAWVAVAVLLGTELFWRFSTAGLPTVLVCVLFLGVAWILVWLDENHRASLAAIPAGAETAGASPAPAEPVPAEHADMVGNGLPGRKRSGAWFAGVGLVLGLLLGLGALTQYSFGWLGIPVLGFVLIFLRGRRLIVGIPLVIGFLLALSPWVARNLQVSGAPFGTATFAIIQGTDLFPGDRLERSLRPDLSEIGFAHLRRKFVANAADILRNELPRLGGSWVSALFLVALMLPFRSVTLSRLRVFLLLCLGVLIGVQALGRTHLSQGTPELTTENLLIWLVPLAFIYGTAIFFILLDQLPMPNPAVRLTLTGAFVAVMSAPFILTLMPPKTFPIVYPPYYPPFVQTAAGWLEEDELMMSDMPWAIAWYGDQQCVWFTVSSPLTPGNDFYVLNDYKKPISALVLTPLTLDDRFFTGMVRSEHHWGQFVFKCLLKGEVPNGFPLKKSPSPYLRDGFFVLADWERWGARER